MNNILITTYEDEPHNLQFSFPRISEEDYNRFWEIVDFEESGDSLIAVMRLQELVLKYPEFIDAWTHIGFAHQSLGNRIDSLSYFSTAVYLGKSSLPSDFNQKKHKILWCESDNRPFLRACHALGLEYQSLGIYDNALDVFMFILDVNPNDNQGVRELVCECYLGLRQYAEFVSFYSKNKNCSMTGMDVSYALALFALGRIDDSKSWINANLTQYRNIWKELIKKTHRKPNSPLMNLGYISQNGMDAAYSYWNRYYNYWVQIDGALDSVRQVLSQKH